MFVHNLNPVFLSIGPFEFRYYGLFYVVGLIMAYFLFTHLARQRGIKITKDETLDLVVYAGIGLMAGGRLFYFLFYNFGLVLQSPLELFKIWNGGMSFHGSLIGLIVAGIIYCKIYKKNFFELADLSVFPAAIALGIGRFGNFINGELFGRVTSVSWAVDFGDGLPRHPSQLYEMAKNFTIFGILWSLRKKNVPTGFYFWLFVMLYGVFRFSIEFVREPDPQLGFVLFGLTMGQVLCSIMMLLGGFMLYKLLKK